MNDEISQIRDELATYGDYCGTLPEEPVMPGPKGYEHNWIYVGGPGLPAPGTVDAPKSRPPRSVALARSAAATGVSSAAISAALHHGDERGLSDLTQARRRERGFSPDPQLAAEQDAVFTGRTDSIADPHFRQRYNSGEFTQGPAYDEQDRATLTRYIGSKQAGGDYRINGKLRRHGSAGLNQADLEYRDALDRAVSTQQTSQDLKVYRGWGTGRKSLAGSVWAAPLKVGDEVQDDGFMSVTLDPWVAAIAAGHHAHEAGVQGQGTLEIRVPAGTPAAWNDGIRADVADGVELLLGRGHRMRIVEAVQENPDWFGPDAWRYVAELVPNE